MENFIWGERYHHWCCNRCGYRGLYFGHIVCAFQQAVVLKVILKGVFVPVYPSTLCMLRQQTAIHYWSWISLVMKAGFKWHSWPGNC